MVIPDKLTYTYGEKIGEAACAGAAAIFTSAMITLMALGQANGGNSILLVVLMIIYGLFTMCSVYPQHTNLFDKPENISEASFRKARRGLIVVKMILMSAIFVLSLPIIG